MCSTRTQTHPPPKDAKKLMGFEPTTYLKGSSLNPTQNPRFYLKLTILVRIFFSRLYLKNNEN
jgi:hypothetical protein